jgi:quinol monooxygenase YgiN
MPVAVVAEWKNAGSGTKNYDAISERMQSDPGGSPQGLIFHAAGYDGDTFRIFEVWESREDHEAYLQNVLMPLISSVASGDDSDPETSVYELHNVRKP